MVPWLREKGAAQAAAVQEAERAGAESAAAEAAEQTAAVAEMLTETEVAQGPVTPTVESAAQGTEVAVEAAPSPEGEQQ